MPIAAYQLIFNCTPAQFPVAINTTLTAVGYLTTHMPIQYTRTIQNGTGASAGTGQVDYAYDGNYFLRFFGANMTAAMITELTTALAGTLGAPVPSNIAVPPYGSNLT